MLAKSGRSQCARESHQIVDWRREDGHGIRSTYIHLGILHRKILNLKGCGLPCRHMLAKSGWSQCARESHQIVDWRREDWHGLRSPPLPLGILKRKIFECTSPQDADPQSVERKILNLKDSVGVVELVIFSGVFKCMLSTRYIIVCDKYHFGEGSDEIGRLVRMYLPPL